jgi:hypothetical protein
MYENKVLRIIFGPKEAGIDCRVRSSITCTLHKISFGRSNQEG